MQGVNLLNDTVKMCGVLKKYVNMYVNSLNQKTLLNLIRGLVVILIYLVASFK